MGVAEGSCGYWAREVSIRGKFVLSRSLGYKTRAITKELNVVLIPGKLAAMSKFRYET